MRKFRLTRQEYALETRWCQNNLVVNAALLFSNTDWIIQTSGKQKHGVIFHLKNFDSKNWGTNLLGQYFHEWLNFNSTLPLTFSFFTGKSHILLLTKQNMISLKDYQKCNVGPTSTSPKKVNTNVLFRSRDGAWSITSWDKRQDLEKLWLTRSYNKNM